MNAVVSDINVKQKPMFLASFGSVLWDACVRVIVCIKKLICHVRKLQI